MRTLFFLYAICLKVSDLFPYLFVRAVIVVLIGVVQLDGISEFQNALLQSDAYILSVLVHRCGDLGNGYVSSGKGGKLDEQFLFYSVTSLCQDCELLVRNLIISTWLLNCQYTMRKNNSYCALAIRKTSCYTLLEVMIYAKQPS